MTPKAFAHINEHKERFLGELLEFLRFPSISAQPSHNQDVKNCALWLRDHLSSIGLDAEIIDTAGHPVVSAKSPPGPTRKLIIYGHYDVQPVDPLDQWLSEPFEPTVRDGFVYCRGASDDKGQLFAHIKAVETVLKTQGELPWQVHFLFEGEEESGGTSLETYVKQNKSDLACEAVIVSDCNTYDQTTPAITYGLRGMAGFEITAKSLHKDVHSGLFGGIVANPVTVLCRAIAECIGPDGFIAVPGFYDDVRKLADWELANIEKLKFDDTAMAEQLGTPGMRSEPGFSTLAQLWARPTFEVNGITGGYSGQGAKTIIPATASAKITMRLVPDQRPEKIAQLALDYIRNVCGTAVELEQTNSFFGADPVLFDIEHDVMQKAQAALSAGFGSEPVFIRDGATIPVVATFAKELAVPVVLMGFGLKDDGPHSPNERFKIDNFVNGMRTSAALLLSP